MAGYLSLIILCTFLIQIQADDKKGKDEKKSDNSTEGKSESGQGPKDPGLIQTVNPNYDAIKGLVCYQCHSVTSELQPLCDKSIFRLATPQEKYNMSLQCPHYQGAYCFTKILKKGRHTETLRGCSGPKDKNGNLMKVGCMTTETEVLCLCQKKFCNKGVSSNGFASQVFALVLAIISAVY